MDAISFADLERQFGEVGLENGPRKWPGKRSTISNEAYLGRRLVLHLASAGRLNFPISVEHGDKPDLRISHGGDELLLEITEACPAEEGRRFAEQAEGIYPIGSYSKTGLGLARKDLLAQVQASIDGKSRKSYAAAANVALLVYPNSDASQWLGFFEDEPEALIAKLNIRCFSALYVLWGDRFIEVSGERP